MDYITLVRGNDTDFNDGNFLTFNLTTTILDLSTFKAVFSLGNIVKEINDLSSGSFSINFTAAETALISSSLLNGVLKLIDTSNRIWYKIVM